MRPWGIELRGVADADEETGEDACSLSPASLPRLGASLCKELGSLGVMSFPLWTELNAPLEEEGKFATEVGEGLAPGLRGRNGGRNEPMLAAMKAPENGDPRSPPA